VRKFSIVASILTAGAFGTGCPGDDGTAGDETGTGSTSVATTSGDDDGAGSTGADSTGAGSADSGSTSTDGGATDSTGGGSSSGGLNVVELVNDGWVNNAKVFFQQGFAVDECWASTYVPDLELYPFEITSASMMVGGEDMGAEDFYVGVWSVDAMGQPTDELASGTANISGTDANLDIVPLDVIGVSPGPIDAGDFAIVVCMPNHAGFPSIARDHDGLDHPDRNWIRLEDGTWISSQAAGLEGDWIMRATVTTL
jgi:hypothetical protein